MKERSKILNLMIAKTDRANSERWLPLWMHSYDTAGVMEYLYHNWLPPAVIKVIGKDFGEEMGLKVCLLPSNQGQLFVPGIVMNKQQSGSGISALTNKKWEAAIT